MNERYLKMETKRLLFYNSKQALFVCSHRNFAALLSELSHRGLTSFKDFLLLLQHSFCFQSFPNSTVKYPSVSHNVQLNLNIPT